LSEKQREKRRSTVASSWEETGWLAEREEE
jgi:hypothetical protein